LTTALYTLNQTPQLVATVNKPGQAILQSPSTFLVNDDASANGVSLPAGSSLQLTYPLAHPGTDPATVYPSKWYAWVPSGSATLTAIVEDV
jgi:hypothetical protein